MSSPELGVKPDTFSMLFIELEPIISWSPGSPRLLLRFVSILFALVLFF